MENLSVYWHSSVLLCRDPDCWTGFARRECEGHNPLFTLPGKEGGKREWLPLSVVLCIDSFLNSHFHVFAYEFMCVLCVLGPVVLLHCAVILPLLSSRNVVLPLCKPLFDLSLSQSPFRPSAFDSAVRQVKFSLSLGFASQAYLFPLIFPLQHNMSLLNVLLSLSLSLSLCPHPLPIQNLSSYDGATKTKSRNYERTMKSRKDEDAEGKGKSIQKEENKSIIHRFVFFFFFYFILLEHNGKHKTKSM